MGSGALVNVTFETATGSKYELDREGRRIRRLSGTHEPTPHQGEDGEWRSYDQIVPEGLPIGSVVWIFWDFHDSTRTSPVVSVS